MSVGESERVIAKNALAGAKVLAAPILAMNALRIEKHFQATLGDDALSQTWVKTYLGGLGLKADARILDFGCGRGRVTALLRQRGFRVAALDIQPHDWWQKLTDVEFVVALPAAPATPFGDAQFDVVLNIDSTHYFSAEQMHNHASEVHRLLRPGGHWIVLQANPVGYGASLVKLRAPGVMHSLPEVRLLCAQAGFTEIDYWYEGLASPLFPGMYARLRHLIAPYPLYMYDQGSWLERLVPAPRRHRWVTRMRKNASPHAIDGPFQMSRWWQGMLACPQCGERSLAQKSGSPNRCPACKLEWSQDGCITEWRAEEQSGAQRLLPIEWIEGRQAIGPARALFLCRQALWALIKTAGFPLRFLMRRRLAAFLRRSFVDNGLAEDWRGHYLKALNLPDDVLMFEYSYRKQEKLGFAGLLGFRIIIQDIRRHAWWGEYPYAWFQKVSATSRYLPLADGLVDLVFTDGVIFDMDRQALISYFRECLRILKPGGYLIIWGGNSLSRSRARSEVRWHGRIHSLEEVRQAVGETGFIEIDATFEGYSPPMFAPAVNMLRLTLAPWQFKTYDFDSWLASNQKPEKRAYWLLRVVKPKASLEKVTA